MEKYYTSLEAARILGLNYHTFMARVRKGKYTAERAGWQKVFDKETIDRAAKNYSETSPSIAS